LSSYKILFFKKEEEKKKKCEFQLRASLCFCLSVPRSFT